jgi:hypothetical protein
MSGLNKGLAGIIKKDHPYCIYEACICHLLDLVIKHSTNDHSIMTKFLVTSRALIAHFNRSSKAQHELRSIFDAYHSEVDENANT